MKAAFLLPQIVHILSYYRLSGVQEFALPPGDSRECRIFAINSANHIDTASTVVVCDTDEQAIGRVKQLRLDRPTVEVWKGASVVAVLKTGG